MTSRTLFLYITYCFLWLEQCHHTVFFPVHRMPPPTQYAHIISRLNASLLGAVNHSEKPSMASSSSSWSTCSFHIRVFLTLLQFPVHTPFHTLEFKLHKAWFWSCILKAWDDNGHIRKPKLKEELQKLQENSFLYSMFGWIFKEIIFEHSSIIMPCYRNLMSEKRQGPNILVSHFSVYFQKASYLVGLL